MNKKNSNKARLAFDLLQKEMQMMSEQEARETIGGDGSSGYNYEDPIIITIRRFTSTSGSTISTYYGNSNIGSISGYMLEPAGPSTSIPNQDQRILAGTYNLKNNPGTKGPYRLYNENIPESRGINIHAGNTGDDTEGCLLPGSSYDKKSGTVGNSRKELGDLVAWIEKNGGASNIQIVIVDMPDGSTGWEFVDQSNDYTSDITQEYIISTGFDDIGYFQIISSIDSSGNSIEYIDHPYGFEFSSGYELFTSGFAPIDNWNNNIGLLSSGVDDFGEFYNFSYMDEYGQQSTGYYHPLYTIPSTGGNSTGE